MKSSVLLFVVLLILPVNIHAQRKSARSKTKPSPAMSPAKAPFDYRPFDLSRDELPPHYLGSPLIEIFAVLYKRTAAGTKGEFESTIDYERRLAALRKEPILGSINAESVVAFVISTSALESHYDADLSVLDFSLTWRQRNEIGPMQYIQFFKTSEVTGHYIGRNAFNRSVRVSVFKEEEFLVGSKSNDLDLLEGRQSTGSYGPFSWERKFGASTPLPPIEAMAAKPVVRALIIGRIADPPFESVPAHESAKIDYPYETYSYYRSLSIVPVAIWFYNVSTGQVYSKLDASTR